MHWQNNNIRIKILFLVENETWITLCSCEMIGHRARGEMRIFKDPQKTPYGYLDCGRGFVRVTVIYLEYIRRRGQARVYWFDTGRHSDQKNIFRNCEKVLFRTSVFGLLHHSYIFYFLKSKGGAAIPTLPPSHSINARRLQCVMEQINNMYKTTGIWSFIHKQS